MYHELKLFYCDYLSDEVVSHSDPLLASVSETLDYMQHLPDHDGNFLGIITPEDYTVQFIYEDDQTITVDIPDEDRIASYTKSVTLEECLEIIRDTYAGKNPYDIPGLVY